jgi:hypothetical protein
MKKKTKVTRRRNESIISALQRTKKAEAEAIEQYPVNLREKTRGLFIKAILLKIIRRGKVS